MMKRKKDCDDDEEEPFERNVWSRNDVIPDLDDDYSTYIFDKDGQDNSYHGHPDFLNIVLLN